MKDDVKDSAPTTTKATNNDKKLRTINPVAEEVLMSIHFPSASNSETYYITASG